MHKKSSVLVLISVLFMSSASFAEAWQDRGDLGGTGFIGGMHLSGLAEIMNRIYRYANLNPKFLNPSIRIGFEDFDLSNIPSNSTKYQGLVHVAAGILGRVVDLRTDLSTSKTDSAAQAVKQIELKNCDQPLSQESGRGEVVSFDKASNVLTVCAYVSGEKGEEQTDEGKISVDFETEMSRQ